MTPTVEDLAEDAFAFVPALGKAVLEWHARFVLREMLNPHPAFGMALRLRLDEDGVERDVATVRSWFADKGRERFTWLVGPSSTPSDLPQRLLALGAVPDETDPVYAGMVLTEPPPEVDGVQVRRSETWDDRVAAIRISWDVFGATPPDPEAALADMREAWEAGRHDQRNAGFVALVDGEIVGSGGATFTPAGVYLIGGNVARQARGRGIYRALVRARWEAAVARGTPVLVVQAGQMSRPILERNGFRTLCEIHALVDRGVV